MPCSSDCQGRGPEAGAGGLLDRDSGRQPVFPVWPRAAVLAVLSTGYGVLQDGLRNETALSAGLLMAVAFGKILTTSLTIGSGGSGGVFGPAMVIGGCSGGAVGSCSIRSGPDWCRIRRAS